MQYNLPVPAANMVYMGGRFTQADADDRGILAALDLTTNKLAWRQAWREICYSGSVVTAGGLLFVGRNDGRLTALDKANGKLLWEFMTDAGVNTTVTTFEWNGDQRVVAHAGGGVFAGATRGDGIWMFSVGSAAPRATLAEWHVDDMWGVYPRPSEPIGDGRPHGDGELIASVHPADAQFVV